MADKTLVSWLLQENKDGFAVGIRWKRIASLTLGSLVTLYTVSVTAVLNGAVEGVEMLLGGLASFLFELVVGLVGIPKAAVASAFDAAAAFLNGLGVLAAPLGFAIAFATLYLWMEVFQ